MKKLLSLIITFLLVFGMTGCQKKTSDVIVIGILPDTGAIPFIIAYENGFFSQQGLNVELKLFYSAVDRDTALQTKAIDGAMTDTMALLFFSQTDLNLKALFNTTSFYYLVTGSAGLNEGKVGISKGTVIEYALDKFSKDRNLEKIFIPAMPVRLQMLKEGQIDLALLPQPLAAAAVLDGAKIIEKSDGLFCPGIFVLSEEITKDRKAVNLFIKAYDMGTLLNEEEYLAFSEILTERYGFPDIPMTEYLPASFDQAAYVKNSDIVDMAEWMMENQLIDQLPSDDSINEMIYTGY